VPGSGEAGPSAADGQVILPAPAAPGPPPPDRPRPHEPAGPPPSIPAELPKRKADPSRPAVPTRRSRPAKGTEPEQSRRPGPPGESSPEPSSSEPSSSEPSSPEPPGTPLPPELFHPLWWQERPSPAGPPPVSQEPGPPGPSPSALGPLAEGPLAEGPLAEPSWGTVLVTTVRLWSRRRLAETRRLWPARASWRVVIAVALVVAVVFVAGAATVALSRSGRAKQPGPPGAGAPAAGALASAAAVRQQAAAWVASQVNPDAIVACDPAMCAALQARGVPAGRLLVLTPARADPLGSDVVVATAAVRSQFGARLAGVYAPLTLATFGSGAARIDVRAAAPDGAAAYRAGLAADIRARKAAGALMLHNSRIHVAAAARAALAGGEIDSRLLVTLATLAHLHPLDIIGFGSPGPGASAAVPLRSADITGAAPPGSSHPVPLNRLLTILQAQRPPYLPSSLEIVRIPPSGAVLRIGYPAPSPLGLLGSGG
jgi:hypothetical protein